VKKLIVLFLLATYLLVRLPALPDFAPDIAHRWQNAAKQEVAKGVATAQLILGRMYSEGFGVSKNEFKAAKLYQKAAEQGDAFAQCVLGIRHLTGNGVLKDEVKGVQLVQKAAEQGNASAQWALGMLHLAGRGVVRDKQTGCALLRASAQQGSEQAIRSYNQHCAAETAAMPAAKAVAPKNDMEKRPAQDVPAPKAGKSQAAPESQAELEKRLNDEITRLVESAEALGTVR